MKPENNNQNFDQLISQFLGRPELKFDFDAWKHSHIEAIQEYEKEIEKTKASVQTGQNTWRRIMKNRLTKYAAAAIFIVGIMLGIHFMGGSPDGAKVVWAEVYKNIESINSFVYRSTRNAISGPGKEGYEYKTEGHTITYHSFEYGTRIDCYYQDGELYLSSYSLKSPKNFISIFYRQKTYSRISADWAGLGQGDPRLLVKHIMSGEYTQLGSEIIDGMEAEGIELEGQKVSGEALDNAVTRLWVDVKTGLPVRIELEGTEHGSETKVKIVQDEFQWNADLDVTVFEPDIPSDYILVEEEESPNLSYEDRLNEVRAIPEIDFAELGTLGLLDSEENESKNIESLTGMEEIWRAQDKIMAAWPTYAEVRGGLYNELLEKLNPDNLSVEEVVHIAVLLREKFWDTGGCLSKTSYRYGYMSRILLEIVHERNPENLSITDELVETIQSVDVIFKYEPNSDKRIRNHALVAELSKLRSSQFDQIKQEVEEGRIPAWEDFVRVCELAILMNNPDNKASAKKAVGWLIDEAEQGEWTAYMQVLEALQQHIEKGEGYGFNIYSAFKPGFPEQCRYARRFLSFKGPTPEKRGVYPAHLLNSKPVWR